VSIDYKADAILFFRMQLVCGMTTISFKSQTVKYPKTVCHTQCDSYVLYFNDLTLIIINSVLIGLNNKQQKALQKNARRSILKCTAHWLNMSYLRV